MLYNPALYPILQEVKDKDEKIKLVKRPYMKTIYSL